MRFWLLILIISLVISIRCTEAPSEDNNANIAALLLAASSQTEITDWKQSTMTINGSISTPSKANSPDVDQVFWRRVGNNMEIVYTYSHTNNTGSASGSGVYLFKIPEGYRIDQTRTFISTDQQIGACGSAYFATADGGGAEALGIVKSYDTEHLALVGGNSTVDPAYHSSTFVPFNSAEVNISFRASVPISGW